MQANWCKGKVIKRILCQFPNSTAVQFSFAILVRFHDISIILEQSTQTHSIAVQRDIIITKSTESKSNPESPCNHSDGRCTRGPGNREPHVSHYPCSTPNIIDIWRGLQLEEKLPRGLANTIQHTLHKPSCNQIILYQSCNPHAIPTPIARHTGDQL